MYTEIYLKVRLKEDTPSEVIDILKYMIEGDPELQVYSDLPDHPLFNTHRWDFMLRCSSYYHVPFNTVELRYNNIAECYYLTGRSDLKNYDGEIAKFFDWIENFCG